LNAQAENQKGAEMGRASILGKSTFDKRYEGSIRALGKRACAPDWWEERAGSLDECGLG